MNTSAQLVVYLSRLPEVRTGRPILDSDQFFVQQLVDIWNAVRDISGHAIESADRDRTITHLAQAISRFTDMARTRFADLAELSQTICAESYQRICFDSCGCEDDDLALRFSACQIVIAGLSEWLIQDERFDYDAITRAAWLEHTIEEFERCFQIYTKAKAIHR
jgi:hypothetical protein